MAKGKDGAQEAQVRAADWSKLDWLTHEKRVPGNVNLKHPLRPKKIMQRAAKSKPRRSPNPPRGGERRSPRYSPRGAPRSVLNGSSRSREGALTRHSSRGRSEGQP